MADLIDILTLAPGADRETMRGVIAEAARETGAAHVLLEPTLPGARFGGDFLLRLAFDGPAVQPRFAAGVVQRDGAVYETAARGGVSPAAGVFRTALFAATRRPSRERLAAFETETASMPRHVAAIRGWRLGRATQAWGRFGWTHVWEQTFETLEGLTQSYMQHPVHWGHVDRWFDPENPDWLIEPGLCHAFARGEGLPKL